MTSKVAPRPHFNSSSLDKSSSKAQALPNYVDSRTHQKPRKSFLHGTIHANYSPREHLSSLLEEDVDLCNKDEPRNSPTTWNYLVGEDDPRSSSPTTSINSGNSSHSEVGDSGVCSEHDTPPPRTRLPQRQHLLSSDSDNESSVSSDSMHEFHKSSEELIERNYSPTNLTRQKKRLNDGNKRKTYRNFIPTRIKIPELLLKEICEKSKLMKKRRQQTWRDSGGVEGCIPPSAERINFHGRQTTSNKLTSTSRRNSYSNLHSVDHSTLSLTASSKFSSTSSLSMMEDTVFPERSSFYNISDYHSQSLFECVDECAGVGFAGLKDIYALQRQESTIRSCKGTVRGVKNRVRAGIATFMSDHQNLKYTEQEKGRLVVYMTTLGIVRDTYERCLRIRKILWTQLVSFEEKDLFLSRDTQIELVDRLCLPTISLPHVFLEGQYLGDVDRIEQLNENGELKRLIQPYKRPPSQTPCERCGGYRYLPCVVCGGSKKSVHRNNFTLEFVALKCSSCDESGLIRCDECPDISKT